MNENKVVDIDLSDLQIDYDSLSLEELEIAEEIADENEYQFELHDRLSKQAQKKKENIEDELTVVNERYLANKNNKDTIGKLNVKHFSAIKYMFEGLSDYQIAKKMREVDGIQISYQAIKKFYDNEHFMEYYNYVAKSMRRSIQNNLLNKTEQVINVLFEIALDKDTCARDRIKASSEILNHSNIKNYKEVEEENVKNDNSISYTVVNYNPPTQSKKNSGDEKQQEILEADFETIE